MTGGRARSGIGEQDRPLFRKIRSYAAAAAVVLLIAPPSALAEVLVECAVGVRVIGAAHDPTNSSDERLLLTELGDQLRRLPFTSYRTVDYLEKNLRVHQRGKFILQAPADGEHYMISVVPHGFSDGRVQLSVDWETTSGERLISTKMRMLNGKNIVLGSEAPRTPVPVICIRALCGSALSVAEGLQ